MYAVCSICIVNQSKENITHKCTIKSDWKIYCHAMSAQFSDRTGYHSFFPEWNEYSYASKRMKDAQLLPLSPPLSSLPPLPSAGNISPHSNQKFRKVLCLKYPERIPGENDGNRLVLFMAIMLIIMVIISISIYVSIYTFTTCFSL